ncbi:aldehyde dehydrogenase family protein [Ponticoccus alexandrii]|uniref:Aldehyde dehydrogenase family protein n=1 Tax=Ponticoccus alexandrii TaxID=1943633 RepID=A0ABX7FDY2_9RHOB|nr:aldehyde dehydrogenase family protein [Ponticoccus alexandrii]ETA50624.1 betaine-aldehyde dehydrogenase [Rhodobacteraceae bacterium PD-2]QRF68608.1 aldehyde dehydrogenase family protein [Ponticoccus alexandrii]
MNIAVTKPPMSERLAAFVRREHKLLINGKWVAPQSGARFDVFNPADGRQIAQAAEAGAPEVDAAVRAARDAFETGAWARMTPVDRGKAVWRLADLIEQHADELAEIEALDCGKPVSYARQFDLTFSVELLRYMAGWSTKIMGSAIPTSLPGNWHCYTMREPVGVCGQIVPWNFPIMMAVWKLAPALAAGCTVVLKPAEQTPLGALRLGELIQEAGIPDGVVNILTGDGRVGAALVEHKGVDKIAFTGSTEVGRLIMRNAAPDLKKVSLELGGKSPAMVFPDADLDLTAAGIANGIFFNSGQCCTASSRIFAHRKIFDKLMDGLAREAEKAQIGPGLLPDTTLGPLISDEQFQKVNGYLESGVSEGAELVTGGERWGNEGYFVKPTVFANTTDSMRIMREEIFGPVVCATPFDDEDLDQLAAMANDTEYGLGASVWTRDIGTAHQLARKIKAGTVWINSHLPNDVALPFGGYKQSGFGREMGYEAIELYTQVKTVAANL